MSIAILADVYDEMRRLAIAGSNLAAGDFRLKKLIPPLEAAAVKAPVFGKVAEAAKKLIESSSQNSAKALLELSTLVSAILYTQGETGLAGKLEPIEPTGFALPSTNTSARLLKPLVEALTTTGSGREEIIRDAHARGAFGDLRLVRLAVAALDDSYAPIADFMAEHILPIYGGAIYDDLRAAYDPKAKGGQVRRLLLMHRLDPERTHELVERALEDGSPDMKVAAMECLEGLPGAVSYLLEQTRSKSTEVRGAAFQALATSQDEAVADAFIKALATSDVGLAAISASRNRHPKLLAALLAEAKKRLDDLLAIDNPKEFDDRAGKFFHTLQWFHTRNDKQTLAFLKECMRCAERLDRMKTPGTFWRINRQVLALLVGSGDSSALQFVVDSRETAAADAFDWVVLAAVKRCKPKQVYDYFSPYYFAAAPAKPGKKGAAKKQGNETAAQRRGEVREALAFVTHGSRNAASYRYMSGKRGLAIIDELHADPNERFELDARWLDAAIEQNDLELALTLARKKHAGLQKYLSRTFGEILDSKEDSRYSNLNAVLETMARIEHPQVVECFLAALRKEARNKRGYGEYWLARMTAYLPKHAASQIEAELPSLPDKLADTLAPYLAELQAKA